MRLMNSLVGGRRWWHVPAIAAIVDIAARAAVGFRVREVLPVEVMLCAVAVVALWASWRSAPPDGRVAPRWQIGIAAFFLLGGMRAASMMGGMPVSRANLIALGVAALGAVAAVAHRAYRARRNRAAFS